MSSSTPDPNAAHVRDLKERYEREGVSNKELKDRLTSVLHDRPKLRIAV